MDAKLYGATVQYIFLKLWYIFKNLKGKTFQADYL